MEILFRFSIVFSCFHLIFSQQFFQRQDIQCITPDRYYGQCVEYSSCPQVVNFLKNRQYLFGLQRSCGTKSFNGNPIVCCTNPTYDSVLPTIPTTTIRATRSPQIVTTSTPSRITTTTATITNVSNNSCRGPDARSGVCIDIRNCRDLLNELVIKSNDIEFGNYLLASRQICGNKGETVCCPSITQNNKSKDETLQPILPSVQEGCGFVKNSFKKIVGGEVSKKGAWPWIALLGYNDELSPSPFKCGGTLISTRHVLTAAHCIRNDLLFVRLGEHDLTTNSEAEHVDINIKRSVVNDMYNRRNGRGDIALLYLEEAVKTNDFISPICMPVSPDIRRKSYANHTPFVVGWGKTMEGGKSANILQELQIPIHNNSVCIGYYKDLNRYISEDQFDSAVICAGELTGGKDTCQGDSGGPLMIPERYENNYRYYLIGIVSYGVGCARPKAPGVYTSTQYWMDWIIEKVTEY